LNPVARAVAVAALAAFLSTAAGCAYFNTLYNARQKYRQALDIKRKADPERPKISSQEEDLYAEAFEGAARVVKYWPDSDWVDDALLLMGQSSLEKGDYSTALRKFDEILAIFPHSEVAPEARLLKGRTLIATRDYAAAVDELNRAAEEGGEERRADVLYHLGLVRREEGDEEGALAALGDVVARHRGSEWFGLAGLAAGDLQRKRGEIGAAVGSYEQVRRRGRTAEERFLGGMRKGEALVELGERARARQNFRDVAKRAANEERRGQALLAEARTVAEGGATDEAVALYRAILATYPRKEAAAEAQFAIAKILDEAGDLAGARAEYELVKEQGTGFAAWQRATARATEIQQVLDLRENVATEGPDRDRNRFLLAEQLLEKIGDVDGALSEYSTLADEASGTEWGAKALYAKAWVLENRLERREAADSALFRLANRYAGTEVDAFARRRLGYPVWKVEKIEPPKVVYVRPEGGAEVAEAIMERVEPRQVPLPQGTAEAKVWVRVGLSLDGSVEETKVVKSGGEELDQASLEAARASRFLAPNEGGPEITVVEYVFTAPRPAATPRATRNVSPPEADPLDPARGALPQPGAPADSAAQFAPGDAAPPDSLAAPPPEAAEPPPTLRNLRLDRDD
jgi:TonB family protein